MFAMKNLFFLEKMYYKNDLRPLFYIYPLFSGQKYKIGKTMLKRSKTGEKGRYRYLCTALSFDFEAKV